jgi:hypothetical protein
LSASATSLISATASCARNATQDGKEEEAKKCKAGQTTATHERQGRQVGEHPCLP